MSRHRRQASQVLPPEFIAGDEPPRGKDQLGTGHGVTPPPSGGTTNQQSTTQQDASVGNSPAPEKKPPSSRST
ncbi:hypothetical protein PanWU01x14_040330 [Parasponia andersonii]|uniref:Uncharacterized protein n=1 Tax=Parasponia andersonii TaxID=3476 RepID=A0A2P5DR51_PARAD|nr:hypothetical protein PanWU01x14_040330 [Parasponia andersonii]